MSTCIWQGTEYPRAIRNRHDDDCEDAECRGCLPCTERHCLVCGKEHVEQQTCPECVGAARSDLIQAMILYGHLSEQAYSGGDEGRLEASKPLLGGEAMVMLSPGSSGKARAYAQERGDDVSHKHDELPGDLDPTLLRLATWEDDWRKTRRSPTGPLATITNCAAFLDEHLDWAAQHHLAFDEFARDLRLQVTKLENILHDGARVDRAAPCFRCKGDLVRRVDKNGRSDDYQCQRCDWVYDESSYWFAVRAAMETPKEAL